jgi:hypothetical protein
MGDKYLTAHLTLGDLYRLYEEQGLAAELSGGMITGFHAEEKDA